MSDTINCLPIRQLTDGPLFSAGPGTLSSLVNMDILPGGYCEARGGMEELKPNGGTGADAISVGGYSDALQIASSFGWIRYYNSQAGVGSQYSKNLALHAGGWQAWSSAGAGTDAVYWGADSPFSRVSVMPVFNGGGTWTTGTFVYEYWNGSAWSALTTAETIDWKSNWAQQFASWTLPTDWAANTIGDAGTGNILKYWMRCRSTAFTTFVTATIIQYSTGYWAGIRELYTVTTSPRTSATSSTLWRYGQSGTTVENFAVGTSLFSGAAFPARMSNYRGRLYVVNGKDQKRWDGNQYADIGLATFSGTITVAAGALASGMGAGVWRYYAAWGYGPSFVQNDNLGTYQQDVQSLYGTGRTAYLGEVTTTAGVNEKVNVTLSTAPPTGVSAAYIYRTNDLTNVPAGRRSDHPAFLTKCIPVRIEGTSWIVGSYAESTITTVFPPTEAVTYDCLPPVNSKYAFIYQNRLFLGDDENWYWSDPFTPDRFTQKVTNYIRLARANGGRHMGGVEFGDQVVLFTEDQTWGLTNVDLDVPQLFPIALGVGCVAPDSIAVVDGLLIWVARDGFYAWDGDKAPKKISYKMKTTFGRMSFDSHGGSKATGHARRYDVRISSPDYSSISTAHRFSLDSGEWAEITPTGFSGTLFPLATIYAPLGNNDAGYLHSLWGKVDYTTSASEYTLMLGELGTTDNGSAYTCSAHMHFPLPPGALFSPARVIAYYQAANGWGTPALGFVPTNVIGSSVGTLNTGSPDTGTDYSVVGGTFSQVGRGTSDLKISFSVASTAGGTVNGQRLFGAVLEGKRSQVRRGGV